MLAPDLASGEASSKLMVMLKKIFSKDWYKFFHINFTRQEVCILLVMGYIINKENDFLDGGSVSQEGTIVNARRH